MVILDNDGLTFDDVQLIPKYSEVLSRDDIDINSRLTTNYKIHVPLIAAPMDTVCEDEMIDALQQEGAVGCLHRFMSIDKQARLLSQIANKIGEKQSWDVGYGVPLCAAIGATGDYQERAEQLVDSYANILLVDVANGDHLHVKKAMNWINVQSWRNKVDIILGNVVTTDSAKRLVDWGADGIRCGVGSGSRCSTRIMTGIGVPQLTAVDNVVKGSSGVPVISDGGIRNPGDAAKAIATGASTVMCGSMLAGTIEAPGDILIVENKQMKLFRGSASKSAKTSTNQKNKYIEGVSGLLDVKGHVLPIIQSIIDGLKSSMSYVGAFNIQEFQQNSTFIRITSAGLIEAHPHF